MLVQMIWLSINQQIAGILVMLSYCIFSEECANEVDDTGGVYFVPAFSGVLAPRWQPDARG